MSANLRLSVIAVALALLEMSGGAVVPRLSDGGGSWFQGAIAQESSAHASGGGSSGGSGKSGGGMAGGSSGGHESGGSSGGHESGGSSGGSGKSGGGMAGGSSGGHESGGGSGCGGGCAGGDEGGGHKGGTEEKGHGLKMHHGGHASGVHQGGQSGQHMEYMGPRRFAGGTGTALHALVPEGLGRYGAGAPSDRGRMRYWGGWTFPEEPPVVPPEEPPVVPPVVPPPVVTPDDPPVVPPPVVTPDEPPVAPPPVATTDPTSTTGTTPATDTTHTTTDTTHTADSSHAAGATTLAAEQPGRYGENAPGDDRGQYGYRSGRAVESATVAEADPAGAGGGPSLNVQGILFSAERCDDTAGGGMTAAQRYSDKNLRRASAAYAQLDPTVKSPVASKVAALLVEFQEELEKPKPDLAAAGVYVGLLAKTPVTPDKVKSVCAHLCMSIPDKQATEIAKTAELQRVSSN